MASSPPSGTVNFRGEGPGGFDFTSCGLLPTDADSSACSVTYTPTAVGDGAHNIDAPAYTHSGDIHSDSFDADGFDITVDKADTTTTITSDDNDPSVVGETYTVTWAVTVDAPGAGTPTGTVTVDDGNLNSCAAPVGAGECDLASTSAGAEDPDCHVQRRCQLQRLGMYTRRHTRSTRPTTTDHDHLR